MNKKKIAKPRNADDVIRRYSEEYELPQQTIREEFQEAESVLHQEPGEHLLREKQLREDATLSAGDLDAQAHNGDSGEETLSGSHATPDQDNVDEMGEAAGLTFDDAEPLRGEKVFSRDDDRWDLDPASSEDYAERTKNFR